MWLNPRIYPFPFDLSDFWVSGGSWIHLEKENGSKRFISP